eukprot:m51a1_g2303 hypothetical protein (255) ;mRNA; r:446699-448721
MGIQSPLEVRPADQHQQQDVVSLEELDLNAVIEGHQRWLARLRRAVQSAGLSSSSSLRGDEAQRSADPRACTFGRWLGTKTPGSFRDPGLYDFLSTTHEQFHAVSGELLALSHVDPQQDVVSLEELDLNGVIEGHQRWLARLRRAVHSAGLSSSSSLRGDEVQRAADSRVCAFGRWLGTKTPGSFRDPGLYDFLRTTHEQFHAASGELLALSLVDPQRARSELAREDSPVNSISRSLIDALSHMQRRQVAAAFT